jgi:hypothetical protein
MSAERIFSSLFQGQGKQSVVCFSFFSGLRPWIRSKGNLFRIDPGGVWEIDKKSIRLDGFEGKKNGGFE